MKARKNKGAVIPRGGPGQGLLGATLGFFIGFAAVSLFGPTARYLQEAAGLSPALAGLLISVPSLSGSLLRIPFSAMVDTTGGRRPFLVLLGLSVIGLAGISLILALGPGSLAGLFPLLLAFGVLAGSGIATFSVGASQASYWFPQREQGAALGVYAGVGNLAPGIFAWLLSGLLLPALGLPGTYLAWLLFLACGTAAYFLLGRDAWYFQLRRGGLDPEEARRVAGRQYGQELFPKGRIRESLKASAGVRQTWLLVAIYFTTFGGFMALTAWFPRYWQGYYGLAPGAAGFLTALFSISASLVRIAGGRVSDRMGGERAAAAALALLMLGALGLSVSRQAALSLASALFLAVGMGVGNAAVFKMVPRMVPEAVGGAAGWVGGLSAFGGFVIPNLLAAFLSTGTVGESGYARGFLVFLLLGLLSLGLVLLLRSGSPGGRRAASSGGLPVNGGQERS